MGAGASTPPAPSARRGAPLRPGGRAPARLGGPGQPGHQEAGARHRRGALLPDYWADAYTPPHTPKRRTIERGPEVLTTDDIFAVVSSGEAVIPFPSHVRRFWARPDIAWLPVPDLQSLAYGLVWRGETENDMIRAFAAVVRDLGAFRQDGPES